MSKEQKRWKARIWIGEEVDQPEVVYGETLEKLQLAAAKWLLENKPLAFGNASPDYELSRRVNYSYSDGTKIDILGGLHDPFGEKTFEEGWYYVEGSSYRGSSKLENFEKVIDHFVSKAIIPEKGPDFKEIPLTESEFPLHLIRTVNREDRELQVNDLLQRGWHIIAIEYSGKTTMYDRDLASRKAIFVLGHPEENAF